MNKETDNHRRQYYFNDTTKHSLLVSFEYAIIDAIEELYEYKFNGRIKDMQIAYCKLNSINPRFITILGSIR